eukprot:Gb_39411 [translate_table: standard]
MMKIHQEESVMLNLEPDWLPYLGLILGATEQTDDPMLTGMVAEYQKTEAELPVDNVLGKHGDAQPTSLLV